MLNLDFEHRTRLVFGSGSISRLGELARQLGAQRVLLVSDTGVQAAGQFEKGMHALRRANLEVEAFLDVHENPTSRDVDAGVAVAQSFRPDLIVGLGGGSSMDCAKGINFVVSCGGNIEDYWGVNKATRDLLPMIAVPTTAGTGSEAQSFALISQVGTGRKMACGDRRAACRIALLDPELTLTMPGRVTSLTGVDAISHALETYVCNRRNPLSNCYSRQAWQLLMQGFLKVLLEPADLEARGQVQLGAFFAGLAIETSMLGAAHALANPLTARFGVTHGQAVGMMLPQVIRFNGEKVGQWYDHLWQDVATSELGKECLREIGGVNHVSQTFSDKTIAKSLSQSPLGSSLSVELLSVFVLRLVEMAGLETELDSLGVPEDSLDSLAVEATQQWTGTFNPRPLSQADFRQIYLQTLYRCEAG